MSVEIVADLAMGSAEIPESAPAEAVVVVIPIVPTLNTDDYAVNLMLPSTLPPEDVVVTAQTTDDVTLTVTRPDGFAGTPGLTVHVLCIQRNDDLDGFWIDIDDAAGVTLDAGWSKLGAQLRNLNSIVYFQFSVLAAASIDGTAKTDPVLLLDFDGMDITWQPSLNNGPIGVAAFDEANQPIMLTFSGGDIFVQGGAGVTGTWTDGVSYIKGLVSWVV